jgi:hypothetical protein
MSTASSGGQNPKALAGGGVSQSIVERDEVAVGGASAEPQGRGDLGPLARTTTKEVELCLPAEAILKGAP